MHFLRSYSKYLTTDRQQLSSAIKHQKFSLIHDPEIEYIYIYAKPCRCQTSDGYCKLRNSKSNQTNVSSWPAGGNAHMHADGRTVNATDREESTIIDKTGYIYTVLLRNCKTVL
jgi:hypothetical protein